MSPTISLSIQRIDKMPYIMRKVRGKACYTVKNKDTGRVHAKCSTKENANKQLHMLRMIDAKKTRKSK